MVKSYSNKITSFLICNEIIKEKEYDLYLYAFETLIAFVINIIVILVVGCIFDRFLETILFLVFYCPIRQFSGGYHAENYKRCLLVFISLYICNIYFLNILILKELNSIIIFFMIISYIGIYICAPLEHRYNPLSKKEIYNYKKIVMYLISVVSLISTIGINIDLIHDCSVYLASVIILIFIMIVFGLIKKSRE